MVVVLPLAAHPHHAVDGARAAEHAPARYRDRTSAGVGLGLGCIEPVHTLPIDELCEADRHARKPMRLAACFQQQHLVAPAFGQAAGERRSGRARANDDEIDRKLSCVSLPYTAEPSMVAGRRCVEGHEALALDPCEVRCFQACTAAKSRSLRLAAHRAVTIQRLGQRPGDPEFHATAQATSTDHARLQDAFLAIRTVPCRARRVEIGSH